MKQRRAKPAGPEVVSSATLALPRFSICLTNSVSEYIIRTAPSSRLLQVPGSLLRSAILLTVKPKGVRKCEEAEKMAQPAKCLLGNHEFGFPAI